ncbi:methyltransferase domain-containing protein [Aetokthonos hydrillicola Thurmond2011]|jgi:2-polyprenyl-3-methyl-5-hydroxy-6-metoxy-1,4-benzoquinol methylase|uniref:Methyltransferase domain-containing protein n=1 Tax=Aetokthonos hydrillicola Thurmond2011 TaxID=2712845 RepID=A0AAP5I202_9CYAN|nr:class I SAM-dependent methyltransferase [Aetokthonos hydrillicola]MBO3462263.1 methyltransferase domain-containing protein [Aetokthonos hydrillicola CCALA 1050]MBW4589494.1 methyltransferase domain-containing protein [Aetokthonos hydrillicola CCALA 1050]MDR9893662.1 methyltransferase domain-containing protein [Aetokthonos hydrillicola Thurmond2011]
MSDDSKTPSPALFLNTVNAYQRTRAISAAIELEIFTTIGEGIESVQSLAQKCQTSERGMRILCDYLVILGFLVKEAQSYGLTPDSAMFLDRRSKAYMGDSVEFLLSPFITNAFDDLATAVRQGGTVISSQGTLSPENPVWVKFAKAMSPMMAMPAKLIADMVNGDSQEHIKVLDISASHGLFGIAFAQRNPNAEICGVDWAPVLEVAKQNAQEQGVGDRYHTIAGSAFDVDYGHDYDVVLLPNFLHHFDVETCEKLLRKIHNSLSVVGRVVVFEFIPNSDRITPPSAAAFALTMLATTPSGDAYTFAEYESMFNNAGFSHCQLHSLPPTDHQLIIASNKQ